MNKIISIDDGRTEVTVSTLMANPETIPTRAIEDLRGQFIVEELLTDGGTASTLEFSFEQSEKAYMDGDPEPIAEFGEFPTLSPSGGHRVLGRAGKRGFRIEISREMRDYNQIQQLNKIMRKAVNTFVRFNEKLLFDALLAAPIPEIPVSVAWNQQGADPRYDLATAMEKVASGGATYVEDDVHESWDPNTVMLHRSLAPVLVGSDKWNDVYTGDLADQSSRYTGRLPVDPLGMTALGHRTGARDRVLVLEKGAPGFFKDPRRLEATPLRGQGGDPLGGDNETYSSRMSQIRFVGIDEPFSACWLTGVVA